MSSAENRGGNRSGAGRPPAPPLLKKESIHIKLPKWLILWMDDQPGMNRAVLIENALKKVHGIEPPNDA